MAVPRFRYQRRTNVLADENAAAFADQQARERWRSGMEMHDIELEDHLDLLGAAINAGGGGLPYFTVAAADSTVPAAASASYVCDGVDDEVEIQAAIDAAFDLGYGPVLLLDGTFYLGAGTISAKTTLFGLGMEVTRLEPMSGTATVLETPSGFRFIDVRDLTIYGANAASRQAIRVRGAQCRVMSVHIDTTEDAIWLDGADDSLVEGVLLVGIEASGVDVDGSVRCRVGRIQGRSIDCDLITVRGGSDQATIDGVVADTIGTGNTAVVLSNSDRCTVDSVNLGSLWDHAVRISQSDDCSVTKVVGGERIAQESGNRNRFDQCNVSVHMRLSSGSDGGDASSITDCHAGEFLLNTDAADTGTLNRPRVADCTTGGGDITVDSTVTSARIHDNDLAGGTVNDAGTGTTAHDNY